MNFEKQERYLVLKLKDIENYLNPALKDQAAQASQVINLSRKLDSKPILECVVIESDWKCYKDAWHLVELEVSGDSSSRQITQIQDRNAELQAQVERLREFIAKGVECLDDKAETIDLCLWGARELLNETPAQSLNAIKADAVEDFASEMGDELTCVQTYDDLECAVNQYANKLRGE